MYRSLLFPLFARLDAEQVHDRTIHLLARLSRRPLPLGLLRRRFVLDDPRLRVERWGLAFPNPLGVAAGLDKNAVAATALHSLGFGHVEVGTVTPLSQPGNPRPRVFRLPADDAVINRMGFPGVGGAEIEQNLARLRGVRPVLGINIGANKAAVDAGRAAADYVAGIERFAPHAAYLAVNISSPNTARLRDLQGRAALDALLGEVMEARDRQPRRPPVLLKIAPDLTPQELDDVLDVVLTRRIDGVIASNTTLARPESLRGAARSETGGLSGAPVRERSTEMIRAIHGATGGRLPIIGVGGVFTADDVWAKLAAGASLVQVYTGFIYGGPLLAARICRDLVRRMEAEGVVNVEAIRD